jgi:hypothetical protein
MDQLAPTAPNDQVAGWVAVARKEARDLGSAWEVWQPGLIMGPQTTDLLRDKMVSIQSFCG